MPRFYLRKLRAAQAAHADDGDVEPARVYAGIPGAPLAFAVNGFQDDESIAVSAIMTPDVAEVTGVIDDVAAQDMEQITTEGADDVPVRRRRRRGRRGGRGRGESEAVAGEELGVLPGEPALPPETVDLAAQPPQIPPSSYLAEMVQTGGLVLPERGRPRRRGAGRGGADGLAREDAAEALTGTPAAPGLVPGVGARGGRKDPLQEMLALQSASFDLIRQQQSQMIRTLERMMMALEKGTGGGGGGTYAATERVAVFVDVPNIVYAAERIGWDIDWEKVLHWVTRDRQLVRATAYAPVSDSSFQPVETQKFVRPFYNLPYRILTKPLKRFANGEIKANFDVELAIDALTMSDRLDVLVLVSGDGDFRRMVELVQAKAVRVEVIAFGSSTATELRTVCDRFIDMSQHPEFCVTK